MALRTLRELPDYEIAPGSPDVLGWTVLDNREHVVGTVVDLIVDTRTRSVRYLGVQLGNGNTVMLPIGHLDLDEDAGVIRSVDYAREQIHELPQYEPPTLTTEVEERYFVLFHREEPVGAWEPSPPEYELPSFRPRSERMRRLGQSIRPRRGEEPPERGASRSTGEARATGTARIGIFAANMPWAVEAEPLEEGPEANDEVLHQAEQSGYGSALGAMRPEKREKPKKP